MSEIRIVSISIDRVMNTSTVGVEVLSQNGAIKEVTHKLEVQLNRVFDGITDPEVIPSVKEVLISAGIISVE